MENCDLAVIGGGPAGLAAAVAAKEKGVNNILIFERENQLGGMLNQCIHSGFGLHVFKEALTGPEYAARFIDKIKNIKILVKLNTMVFDLTKNKIITAVNEKDGIFQVKAKSVIICTGCREKPSSIMNIFGRKYAGIFTAGSVQKFINVEGYMPGKKVVIIGSNDIALIVARRITLEGGKVNAVVERLPYCRGFESNVEQCLGDFKIPLKLNHTIIDIKGKSRVEGVIVAAIDKNKKIIGNSKKYIPCDTVVLSADLFPENELSVTAGLKISNLTYSPLVNQSLVTNVEGIFVCGNALYIHNLVDNITLEGTKVGENAASYIKGNKFNGSKIKILSFSGVKYTIPQYINIENINEIESVMFKVTNVFRDRFISVYFDDVRELHVKKKMLTPWRIEKIQFTRELLERHSECKQITISVQKN